MIALTESSNPPIYIPTQDDLPSDDDDKMETSRHKYQMDLLLETIYPWLEKRQNGYAGGNMFIYFSLSQVKNKDYKGPDFFCVLDVEQKERKSWVVWEEGKAPDVVIELLSDSTASYDKNDKKSIYQNKMRVPEYFWYDPFTPDDWAGFSLVKGVYQPLKLDEFDRYISEQLQLALVRWQGVYRGIDTIWLRWQTLEGDLLPTDKEISEVEKQRADEAQQLAEAEKQRAEEAQQLAEAEKKRAEEAQQLAETEKQRAESALSEIAKLKELLKNSGIEISD
ncbi:Uma2 family endonuclease [Geminocystis sp. CENA526]|uniref:Uma2 family endonuclease n=1 Tax=Geminocystis sp. CENA526 TaxID=1355871 RepID=UPI003D6F0713